MVQSYWKSMLMLSPWWTRRIACYESASASADCSLTDLRKGVPNVQHNKFGASFLVRCLWNAIRNDDFV